MRVECLETALFYKEKFGRWAGHSIKSLGIFARERKKILDNLSEKHRAILIENLGFNSKITKYLSRAGIETVGQMISLPNDKLMRIRGFDHLIFAEWTEKLYKLISINPEDLNKSLFEHRIPDRMPGQEKHQFVEDNFTANTSKLISLEEIQRSRKIS